MTIYSTRLHPGQWRVKLPAEPNVLHVTIGPFRLSRLPPGEIQAKLRIKKTTARAMPVEFQ